MVRSSVVVDQIFACIQGDDIQSRFQDFVLSMVFANAAARAKSQASGGLSHEAFRSAWSSTLGNIGWVVTNAGTSNVSMTSRGATITLAANIVANAPTAAVKTAVSTLQKSIENDIDPSGSSSGSQAKSDALQEALPGMWWKSGIQFFPFFASLGQVDLSDDVIRVELVQFSVDLDRLRLKETGLLYFGSKPLHPNSAAALFKEVLQDSIDLDVFHITAELQTQSFGQNRADLIGKLGAKVFDHFETSPAGLFGARS